MSKISGTARVQVTLEVSAGSSWGQECQLDQVYKQATEDAVLKVHQFIQDNPRQIKLLGIPKVTVVLVDREFD